jgi:hypothetical protein
MADTASIAATYRAEADKAQHKTLAFAVILVLVHLLDIRPSEADALGLKVAFKNPVIIYGSISLLFGYYLSRWLSLSEKSEAMLPLTYSVAPRRMRYNLQQTRRMYRADKKTRINRPSPKAVKRSARKLILSGNLILMPYRLVGVFFVMAAMIFLLIDLYGLADLIWSTTPVWDQLGNYMFNEGI